jgi:hypothetical protein
MLLILSCLLASIGASLITGAFIRAGNGPQFSVVITSPGGIMEKIITLPPLAEGETYIGSIGDATGNVHHVILLPGDNDDAEWDAQMEWAKSIGGDLPNRTEQAMLWANHRDQFQKDWYWSNEVHHKNDAYAWCQNFTYGLQYRDDRRNSLRARAVRRLPI